MTVDDGDALGGASLSPTVATGDAGVVWVHLRAENTSVVILSTDGGMPTLAHWGPSLTDGDVEDLTAVSVRPLPQAALDIEAPLGLVAESGRGFIGTPGIAGHRSDGQGFGPEFKTVGVERRPVDRHAAVSWRLTDDVAELDLELDVRLCLRSGVLQLAPILTNRAGSDYHVHGLAPSFPLPARADELLTFGGRWTLEFQTHRRRWADGAWVSENRRGRTSHDRVPAMFAGTDGFTETDGEAWGVNLGWSGNSRLVAERLSDGRRHLQVGELLLAGEVTLGPGESLRAPTAYGAYSGTGLGDVSSAFHRFLRARSHHPGPDRPRPVMLNTWEAVYFDHDPADLMELASRAADVGVERFVLDDGWFTGRNSDGSALGDWTVDHKKYPAGLTPLVDHVTALGMEFGLWVEPEMINPDSELYRKHPEWILHDARYPQRLFRNQLVLDLVNAQAWKYVLERMDQILADNSISYIKWDMNRDLVRPTHEHRAGARAQTIAVYQLLDEIRARHPNVEFESCSSGGARADFEILTRTERIWPSDSNDALDRQAINRGFSLLFPPEIMGSHIGPPASHTTGRVHDLGLRSASAFLGHLGIEWNLLTAPDEERAELGRLVALYKRHRALLHGGDWRRLDSPDPSANTMGVVAADCSEALFVYARVASVAAAVPAPIRFTHLDPDRRYLVTNLDLPGRNHVRGMTSPPWIEGGGVEASGRVLMTAGLQPPITDPESALLIHLEGI